MRSICALVVLVLTFVSIIANASDVPNFDIGVGTNITDFNYREMGGSPDDTESGVFETFLADVKYHPFQTATNIEARYETASAKLNYWAAGTFSNPSQSISDQVQNDFSDYALYLNFSLADDLEIYVGYGYRYWRRDLGYFDDYSWQYVPVGIRYWIEQEGFPNWAFDFSVTPVVGARFKVIPFNGQDSSGTLVNETGVKLAIPIEWKFTENFFATTTPWASYNSFGHSGVIYNSAISTQPLAEPNSQTLQFGAEILLGLSI